MGRRGQLKGGEEGKVKWEREGKLKGGDGVLDWKIVDVVFIFIPSDFH